MLKKLGLVTGVLAACLFTGYGLTYAYVIPGTTEPYDPIDYYSSTTVSAPDSAPSPFALKELTKGIVFDPLRKAKSVLYSVDLANISTIFTSKTLWDVLDISPIESEVLNNVKNSIIAFAKTTYKSQNAAEVTTKVNSTLFRQPDNYDETTNPYNKTTQLTSLDNSYQTITSSTSDIISDASDFKDALNTATDNSSNAQGDLAAVQAGTQIEALAATAMQKRTALISNYTAMESLHNADTEDRELEATRIATKVSAYAVDPYNLTAYDASVYTKANAPGMPDF
jgi:hypothetical protein